MKRYAIVFAPHTVVERYLPANYAVVDHDLDDSCIIEGRDVAGWTLDGYVLPRLASGLIFGEEVNLSHEEMKRIPEAMGITEDYFTFDAARRWIDGAALRKA